MDLLKKLNYFFDRKDRFRIAGLLVMILVGAALESLGVGLIMPYIALITDPTTVHKYRALAWVYAAGGFASHREFALWTGVGFIGLYVAKNLFVAALLVLQSRFVAAAQVKLSRRLLSTYLAQDYGFHLRHNSAELIATLNTVGSIFAHMLLPLLVVVTDLALTGAVAGLLLVVEPVPTLVAVAVFGAVALVFYKSVRGRLKRIGVSVHAHNIGELQTVQQALGGIKETKILGTEAYFLDLHSESMARSTRLLATSQVLGQLPKVFLETLMIGGIVGIICIQLLRGIDAATILPTLALFAVAGMRLMPSLNRILANALVIRQSKHILDEVHATIRAQESARGRPDAARFARDPRPLEFEQRIELRDVRFGYEGGKGLALDGVSLTIPKGSSIALIGPSGSGKTTLVDVILGLLTPTGGLLAVDGQPISGAGAVGAAHDLVPRWQRNVGYIPQQIFLSDETVRGNVAFGVPSAQIDDARVWSALRAAQLEELVRGLERGLETPVGERGVRLSGGQRQRIGIARALYRDPEVLILDEATAALDAETEREVTRAIDALGGKKTIILIAHRLATARGCDRVYRIEGGRVAQAGTFAEVCGS